MMEKEYHYPKHIYDPLRRQIAVEFMEHEWRKLFPSVRNNKIWQLMDGDVANWFENNNTMAPVRDFWNGFHGVSRGFKLAGLVYRITSINIEWQKKWVNVADLQFVTRSIRGLNVFEMAPTVMEVMEYYDQTDHLAEKKDLHREIDNLELLKVIRDQDPIIVIKEKAGNLIHDGNHRVLRRILRGEDKIEAYIGRQVAEPMLDDYWLPTQMILDILALANMENEIGIYARVIFDMIKHSRAGQIEFARRCLNKSRQFDQKMYQAVKKLAMAEGIVLPADEYWS